MKLLRAVLLLLVVLDFLDPAHGFLTAMTEARASTIPLITGPQDPSQMNATFNLVINEINAILSPLTGSGLINGAQPGTGATATNFLSLTPGVSGSGPFLDLAPGGDANASIGIQPNGNGNIILFQGLPLSTGLMQFANEASFIVAPTIGGFPGGLPGAASFQGIHPNVQGVMVFKDWLGFTRGVAVY